jgi:hypothetical protein
MVLTSTRRFVCEATDAMIDSFVEIRSAAGLAADLRPLAAAMPLAAAEG